MRMRTLPEIVKCLKEEDPNTALNYCALRRKVLTGEIPHVQVGRKRLIDMDRLSEYLEPACIPVVRLETGKIRRIEM